MALTEICGILIYSTLASVGTLTIGGQGTANAWTSWIGSNTQTVGPINPGGLFFLAETAEPAWAVGNASNNLLRLTAAGGNVTYDMYILGRQ